MGLFSGLSPEQLRFRAQNGASWIGVDALPENLRNLGMGTPGTHFVNKQLAAISPEAAYNADPRVGINTIYQQFLGRNADQAGMDYWLGQQKAGASFQDLLGGIRGSSEFTRVTPEQQAYVQGQAQAGMPSLVSKGTNRAGESTFSTGDGAVRGAYASMLGRMPTQEELAYYSPLWKQNGNNIDWLKQAIAASPEYSQYQTTGQASQVASNNPFDKASSAMLSQTRKQFNQSTGQENKTPAVQNTRPMDYATALTRYGIGSAEAENAKTNMPSFFSRQSIRPRGMMAPTQPVSAPQPTATMQSTIQALQQPQQLRALGMFNANNMPQRW